MTLSTHRTALVAATITALALLVGCSTGPQAKKTNGPSGDEMAMESARTAKATERLTVPNLDPKVLMYAVVPNAGKSAATARQIAQGFDPSTPDLMPFFTMEIGQLLGWSNADALATDKPMAMMLVDIGGGAPPEPLFIFDVRDKAGFKGALQSPLDGDKGNAMSYETFALPSGKAYINYIGDTTAVMTAGEETYAIFQKSIGELASRAPEADIVVGLEISNFMALYGQMVRQEANNMRAMMNQAMAMQPMGQANAQNLDIAFDFFDRLSSDTDRAEIQLTLSKEAITMRTMARMKDGSVIDTFLREQPRGDLGILSTMPGAEGMVMAYNIDFKAADGVFKTAATKMLSGMFPQTVTQMPAFSEALEGIYNQMGNEFGAVASFDGGIPFAGGGGYVQVFTVKDKDKYTESFRSLSSFYSRDDVKKQLLDTYGMKIEFTPNAYQLDGIEVDRTVINYDFSQMEPGTGEMMQAMGMGQPMVFDVACNGTRCVQVQDGTDPKNKLSAMLQDKLSGPTAQTAIRDAGKQAAPNPIFFMYMSYKGIGNLLGTAMGMGAMGMGNPLDVFAPGQGAVMSIGTEPGYLDMVLHIPIKMRQ